MMESSFGNLRNNHFQKNILKPARVSETCADMLLAVRLLHTLSEEASRGVLHQNEAVNQRRSSSTGNYSRKNRKQTGQITRKHSSRELCVQDTQGSKGVRLTQLRFEGLVKVRQ